MTSTRWLALGFVGLVLVACGGNGASLGTSQGELGGGPAADGTGSGSATAATGTASGGGTTPPDCTAKGACGPALGMPSVICADGSIGGNTGKCILKPGGTCGWEIRQCPKPVPPPACFDTSGNLDPSLKQCNTAADCTVVPYQQNCCGTMHAAGVSASKGAQVTQCAADRAASLPKCGCPTGPTLADDGSTDPGGATPAVTCNAGICETTFKGEACGKYTCTKGQTCCSGMPLPEPRCVDGGMCPISQRKMKKDISYLSDDEKRALTDELLGFRLATYRYKTEREDERTHLGFIIDDVAPSPAVMASGERVDMYGYATMSVAALQMQAREIAELRRQVEELQRERLKASSKR